MIKLRKVNPRRNMPKKKMKYAGFGERLMAMIIDGLILAAVGIAIRGVGLSNFYEKIDVFVGAVYIIYFWVNRGGATIGKNVMKIKVVTTEGKPVNYQKAIIRYLGYIVSGLPVFLGFLWVLWDDKKQGFHDKIAGTVVVKI